MQMLHKDDLFESGCEAFVNAIYRGLKEDGIP